MKFLVASRQNGKTTRAIEWVLEGEECPGYPGWTRVLIVADMQRADRLRRPGNPYGLDYRQVFYVTEWQQAYQTHPDTELAIDDVDDMIRRMFQRNRVRLATATGDTLPLVSPTDWTPPDLVG